MNEERMTICSRHFMPYVDGMPWRDKGMPAHEEIVMLRDGSEVRLMLWREGKLTLERYCDEIAERDIPMPIEATPQVYATTRTKQWGRATTIRNEIIERIVAAHREAVAAARAAEEAQREKISRETAEREARRIAIQATGERDAPVEVVVNRDYRYHDVITMTSESPLALAIKVAMKLIDMGPRTSGAEWSDDFKRAIIYDDGCE